VALYFDGTTSTSYAHLSSVDMAHDTVLVSVWLKVPTTATADNYGRIFECGGYNASDDGGISIERNVAADEYNVNGWYYVTGALTNSTKYTPSGNWEHLAIASVNVGAVQYLKWWLNGTFQSESTGSVRLHTTSRCTFGCAQATAGTGLNESTVAEFAVYHGIDPTAGGATDITTMLSSGLSPLFVRPDALVCYEKFPGVGQAELIGGATLTLGGGEAQVDHPRMIYPSRPHIITAPAAAAGSTIPPFWQHYRQLRTA